MDTDSKLRIIPVNTKKAVKYPFNKCDNIWMKYRAQSKMKAMKVVDGEAVVASAITGGMRRHGEQGFHHCTCVAPQRAESITVVVEVFGELE